MKTPALLSSSLLLLCCYSPLQAIELPTDPAEKGRTIAEEGNRLDTGWHDMTGEMHMSLHNKQGQNSTRAMKMKSFEILDDGDKSLIIFNDPRDVKGTAFLSFTHSTQADDQWLYLPALKRVKRISSKNKSGPFMGSEFAYEDMTSQEPDRYTYKWLRDEKLGEHDCFVVERYPTYKHSGYTRQIVWVDKTMWQPRQVEYYDRKNSLLKILTFLGYQQYIDQFWRADVLEMKNQQNGKSTDLTWTNYQFKTGLTERDFDRNSLKRAR